MSNTNTSNVILSFDNWIYDNYPNLHKNIHSTAEVIKQVDQYAGVVNKELFALANGQKLMEIIKGVFYTPLLIKQSADCYIFKDYYSYPDTSFAGCFPNLTSAIDNPSLLYKNSYLDPELWQNDSLRAWESLVSSTVDAGIVLALSGFSRYGIGEKAPYIPKTKPLPIAPIMTSPAKIWEQNIINNYLKALESYASKNNFRVSIVEKEIIKDGRTHVHFRLETVEPKSRVVLEMKRVFDGNSKQVDLFFTKVGKPFRRQGIFREVFTRVEPPTLINNNVVYVRASFDSTVAKRLFYETYQSNPDFVDVGWPMGFQEGITPRTDLLGIRYVKDSPRFDPRLDIYY